MGAIVIHAATFCLLLQQSFTATQRGEEAVAARINESDAFFKMLTSARMTLEPTKRSSRLWR